MPDTDLSVSCVLSYICLKDFSKNKIKNRIGKGLTKTRWSCKPVSHQRQRKCLQKVECAFVYIYGDVPGGDVVLDPHGRLAISF